MQKQSKKLLFQGKRILVVEDTYLNRELAVELLKLYGCHVDAASSGDEALHFVKNFFYDLILMDIQMPEKDGFQITEEIHSLGVCQKKGTKIIALTAFAFPHDREKCLSHGMADHISKPIDIDAFEKTLSKHLELPHP